MSPTGLGSTRPSAATGRIVGLDLARFLAIAAMMAAHIVPDDTPDGRFVHTIVDGRSAALFAVLAGVSLALTTGRANPVPLRQAAPAICVRAVIVIAIGLILGALDTFIAVILVNYGLLFLASLAVIRLRAPALLGLAAGWTLASPVVSFWLRSLPLPGDSPGAVPAWPDLAHPVDLLVRIVLTGYYPVLTWFSYLLLGLAVGRSRALGEPGGAARLLALGVAGWLGALGVAAALERAFGLSQWLPLPVPYPIRSLAGTTAFYGTTPTTSGWWLLTDYRHSGTTLDLIGTSGSAVAVLGGCLLLARSLGRAGVLLVPLAVAGSMPLSLYSAHIVLERGRMLLDVPDGVRPWLIELVFLLVLAGGYRLVTVAAGSSPRGPLEALTATVVDAVRPAATERPPDPRMS